MRNLLGVLLGMLSALVMWQAIMTLLGTGLLFSGIYAGVSLAAFAIALFWLGGILVQPKEENHE